MDKKTEKKKRIRRSRQKGPLSSLATLHDENAKLAAKFQRNNGKKSTPSGNNSEDCHPPFLRFLEKNNSKFPLYQVRNAPKHDRLLARHADDGQGFRAEQPPTGGAFVESTWLCALCQLTSSVGKLGDLFGPYYFELSAEKSAVWPPYLNKPKCTGGEKFYTELWFHGDCLVWAPLLFLCGTRLEGLKELATYWKLACDLCQQNGASIRCSRLNCNKAFHYSCAEKEGCELDLADLTAHCRQHLVEKEK